MSQEMEEQTMVTRGNTASYLLAVIAGIGFNVLYFLYTFYVPRPDPFLKLIHLMLSVGLVIVSVAFVYQNMNFLRTLLKIIGVTLSIIHVYASLALFGFIGIFMIIWYGLSVFLLFITFKWLKDTDEGGEVAFNLRKNWEYYTTLVLGASLICVFLGTMWLSQTSSELFKLVLMADSGLLVVVSLAFTLAKTRRHRTLMTILSGALFGIHGYLSIALYPGIGVYVFGWFGFSLLIVFAAFNWFKE